MGWLQAAGHLIAIILLAMLIRKKQKLEQEERKRIAESLERMQKTLEETLGEQIRTWTIQARYMEFRMGENYHRIKPYTKIRPK